MLFQRKGKKEPLRWKASPVIFLSNVLESATRRGLWTSADLDMDLAPWFINILTLGRWFIRSDNPRLFNCFPFTESKISFLSGHFPVDKPFFFFFVSSLYRPRIGNRISDIIWPEGAEGALAILLWIVQLYRCSPALWGSAALSDMPALEKTHL